jgi:tryptophan synthase alpha subunit
MTCGALTTRIRAANAEGRAALGLFLIPGFPDWKTSVGAVTTAVGMGVDFIEFPVSTRPRWSQRTGSLIGQTLADSTINLGAWSGPLKEWLSQAGLSIAIVYESAWPQSRQWVAAKELHDIPAAIMLEADVKNYEGYAAKVSSWGSCLIPIVNGCAAELDEQGRYRLSVGQGFVYVCMGSKTGQLSAGTTALRHMVDLVRERRPDLPVCCAFGLRTPDDVRRTRIISGCDGVIIGTGALEVLQHGLQTFTEWLRGIMSATAIDIRGDRVTVA